MKMESIDCPLDKSTIPFSDTILSTHASRASVSTALARVKRKLSTIVAEASQTTPTPSGLPSLVTGPLPLLPSTHYSRALEEYLGGDNSNSNGSNTVGKTLGRSGGSRFSARKKVVPAFLADQLNLPAAYALQPLYFHRKYQFLEDGVRFLNQALLDAYVDKYASKQLIRKITANSIKRRPWFCSEEQWQNDFGEANFLAREQSMVDAAGREDDGNTMKMTNSSGQGGVILTTGTDAGKANGKLNGLEDTREYSVLADELFTRCPISRERFVSTFDGESGEMWYKNAAKVLVTSLADVQVYNLAKETEHPKMSMLSSTRPWCWIVGWRVVRQHL